MSYTRAKPKDKYNPKSTRLLDQVREVLRYPHYAVRTEAAYLRWIAQYIKHNGTRHPEEMGKMAQLLYGSGLRLMEAVRMRIQDLDFDNRQLSVRDGKGNKDRSTLFPEPLHVPLSRHLEQENRPPTNPPAKNSSQRIPSDAIR